MTWRAPLFLALFFGLLSPNATSAQSPPATATVTVTDNGTRGELAARCMGLSYEMSLVLPKNGEYYFDPKDQALLNTYRMLGNKSLRVGAAAADHALFAFARAAGVKVIYSLRLRNGDPAVSARLAASSEKGAAQPTSTGNFCANSLLAAGYFHSCCVRLPRTDAAKFKNSGNTQNPTHIMKAPLFTSAAACVLSLGFSSVAFAAPTPTPTASPTASPTANVTLYNGFLLGSKIEGSSIKNLQNQTIGTIKDLIVNPDTGHVRFALLSVGGFLGMGDTEVVVPWGAIGLEKNKPGDAPELRDRRHEGPAGKGLEVRRQQNERPVRCVAPDL